MTTSALPCELAGGQVAEHLPESTGAMRWSPRSCPAGRILYRHHRLMASPAKTASVDPEGEERPEGDVLLEAAQAQHGQHDPDNRDQQDAEEHPGQHALAEADPPQEKAQRERQWHIAEAHALGLDEVEDEQRQPGQGGAHEGVAEAVPLPADQGGQGQQRDGGEDRRVDDVVGDDLALPSITVTETRQTKKTR